LRLPILILLSLIGATSCFAQLNLGFEKWNVNYNGIDEAKNWINTADATKFDAPATLFKLVDNPGSGLASLKLTTAYWPKGAPYNLDTLVGSLLQQHPYTERPESFEFIYKCAPKNDDEILVGVQLTKSIEHNTVVIGEGFFTNGQTTNNWTNEQVKIDYYSDQIPDNINLIAMSSANAVLTNGNHGYAKIGSTLYLDNFKLKLAEKRDLDSRYFVHVYPNPAKSFINITTNSPERQQIEIYTLSSQLLLNATFSDKSKIDISMLNSGTYVYKVYNVSSGKTTATNKFNIIR